VLIDMFDKAIDNEKELLASIAGGDQYAFTILFKHYQRFVYFSGRKLTHSEELATEIVQDIFLKIWLDREQLIVIESFGAYLNRIVRNHSFNVLRQLAQRAKSTEKLKINSAETDNSTVEKINHNDATKLLNEALKQLSPQQRMVYNLCHEKGYRYEDAAEKMDISPQTVHSHMKLALRKIREHFIKHAGAYPFFIAVIFK
jgi:RNA polymerase sigma-70 factor (family 1)